MAVILLEHTKCKLTTVIYHMACRNPLETSLTCTKIYYASTRTHNPYYTKFSC